MKHTEEYINELLAKYITGEVMSDSEKNDIQEWIATHADEYNRLVKLISPCRRIQQAGKTYIAKEGSRIRNSKSMGQNRRAYKQDVGKETGNEYLNKQEQEEVIGHVGFLCSSFGPCNSSNINLILYEQQG